MNLRNTKKNKTTSSSYNTASSYDNDGFYNDNSNTYSNYNDQTNEDAQYYDGDGQQYVDQNYVDDTAINDANYTDDSWNTNEEDYYPKPKKKASRFVRPRPKHKTNTNKSTSFQPLQPQQQQHTSSSSQPDMISTTKAKASRPRPPSSAASAQSFNNGLQSLAEAGLAAAATSGVLGSNTAIGAVGSMFKDRIQSQLPIPPGILSLAYYKYYFRVHNEYVRKKLTRLLLPFLRLSVKDWKRQKIDEISDENIAPPPKLQSAAFMSYSYQPPIYDINAPDGYLPLMAVITYIVIMGFVVGTQSSVEGEGITFSPQILIATGSSAFVMLLIEVLLMKIGFYLIGSVANPPYWLDIVCYTGYKLVFVTINLIINLIFDSLILYYIVSIVTGVIAAIFMIQTLRPYFRDLSEFASGPLMDIASSNEPKKTRKIFLGIVGIAQILFIQWMGRYTSV